MHHDRTQIGDFVLKPKHAGTSMHRSTIQCRDSEGGELTVNGSSSVSDQEVYRFIFDHVDSVPHLEALLLIWNTRPSPWSVEDLARRLYVERSVTRVLLQDLARRELIANAASSQEQYFYASKSLERDKLIAAVDAKYRLEVVEVSTLIHRKASSALRDFADAFRFNKERD
jgi:hypothetical protein